MADSWEDLPDVKSTDWEALPDASGAPATKPTAAAPAKPSAQPDTGPSLGRSVAEGALQGGTYGFSDELQGFLGATRMEEAPDPDANIFGPDTFADRYRTERNAARRDREAAEKANPRAYAASQIAAALLAPGPKPGRTVGSFVKGGAKAGGMYGLGASDADLTAGDVGGALLDSAVGTTIGGAGGLLGGLISKSLLQPLVQKANQMGQRAMQRGVEQANKPIDKAINSTRGALGGEVAAGQRGIEHAEAAAVNPRLSPQTQSAGAAALTDPEIQLLEERVARSQIGQLHGRLPRIDKAQQAFDDALVAGDPAARQAAVDALMSRSPMKRAIWEITKRIAPTAIGASLGGSLGGSAGAGVGGALGLFTGAMSGRPGRIITNALRSPQFQRDAAQTAVRGLDETVPGAMMGATAEQAGDPKSAIRSKLAPYLELLGERDE